MRNAADVTLPQVVDLQWLISYLGGSTVDVAHILLVDVTIWSV